MPPLLLIRNPHSIRAALKCRPQDVKGLRSGGALPQEIQVFARTGQPIEQLVSAQQINQKGLWLALDELQDPRNLGAIFRTAAFFGVQGIILTQNRCAPLTATVYDVAAGGLEYVPFTLVSNLKQCLESLKTLGIWVLGASEHAEASYQTFQRDRAWVVVLGSEGKGIRPLIQKTCDCLCQIRPMSSEVMSLNVSVAAGLLIAQLGLPVQAS